MTFRQRGKIALIILCAYGALMVIAAGVHVAIYGMPEPNPEHKSDKQMIREAGDALDAACELNEDKC